jgi:predicted DNA-binding ribbon-helix-helix protein
MWDALHDVAKRRRLTIHDLVTSIDDNRTESSLTAAIRVYIVNFYRGVVVQSAQAQPERPPELLM